MARQRRLILLTKKEKSALWGETGPYSQASMVIQTRILDDRMSRVFLEVKLEINPYAFELIKEHRNEFADDETVQQILDGSEFRGQRDGYISCPYSHEYKSKLLEEANKYLNRAEKAIIRMHKFVLKYLDADIN